MPIIIAFGVASIMLLIGTLLRAKVRFFQSMLIPAAILAGILGLIFLNLADAFRVGVGTKADDFSVIVDKLFVISFISITLMKNPDEESKGRTKNMLKGALAIGLIWCLLFSLTPFVSALLSL